MNYDYKLKYLPSTKLGHMDGLSRLIQKHCEPFIDTVITPSRSEVEIKNCVECGVWITGDPRRHETNCGIAEKDKFIIEMKRMLWTRKVNKYRICVKWN